MGLFLVKRVIFLTWTRCPQHWFFPSAAHIQTTIYFSFIYHHIYIKLKNNPGSFNLQKKTWTRSPFGMTLVAWLIYNCRIVYQTNFLFFQFVIEDFSLILMKEDTQQVWRIWTKNSANFKNRLLKCNAHCRNVPCLGSAPSLTPSEQSFSVIQAFRYVCTIQVLPVGSGQPLMSHSAHSA